LRSCIHAAAALPLIALAACSTTRPEAPRSGYSGPPISLATLTTGTQILSSDAFEGRAPTTAGEDKTVAYVAEGFRKAGLIPGNGQSWYQNVPLVETSAQPTALRITGGSAPITLNYRTDFVANSYQVQPRIALDNSELVFVGYGINAPERGWNDYAGVDVRGKTVVILINDPDWEESALQGRFGGKAMTYYGRWTYKYEEAARQGAAGALIVHDTAPASYGWNVVQSSWTGAQYNMDEASGHMDQSKVVGWLTNEAAQRVFAASGQDLRALSAAAKRPGFRAVPLGTRASISMQNAIKRQVSRNVIGILPGRRRPQEYVIYTAHWDHLGRCDPDPSGDNICNGAVDNASGTAGLIALAEAHAKQGNADRTIVFLAVTAEESGLLGSKYYAENPIFPLAKTVGGVNMDSLSLAGDARDFVAIGGGKSELDAYLARATSAHGLRVNPEPNPQAGYYYRSDHFSLAKQGVPMIYAKLGNDLVSGGTAAGDAWTADYRANRYHGPNDEYDPNWNWSGAIRELQIFYQLGRELAMTTAWPNWNQGDEFRAVRDRSRAGAPAR
jgi:Zn-dependent M28 family amino/carboxypeptidase